MLVADFFKQTNILGHPKKEKCTNKLGRKECNERLSMKMHASIPLYLLAFIVSPSTIVLLSNMLPASNKLTR